MSRGSFERKGHGSLAQIRRVQRQVIRSITFQDVCVKPKVLIGINADTILEATWKLQQSHCDWTTLQKCSVVEGLRWQSITAVPIVERKVQGLELSFELLSTIGPPSSPPSIPPASPDCFSPIDIARANKTTALWVA